MMKPLSMALIGSLTLGTATMAASTAAHADGVGVYVGPLSLGINIGPHRHYDGDRYCSFHYCGRPYWYGDRDGWRDRDERREWRHRRWHDRDDRRGW